MFLLKQSTASQEVPLGYFVDSTDGNTEETALTPANTDIKIWKSGATTLANKNSGGATHISNGIYYAVLDATDTNTLGPIVLFVHVSGALPVRLEGCVVTAAAYDLLVGNTLTETYRSADTAPTITQLLYEVLAILTQFDISGTTLTTRKIDGTTAAKTYTLNSATAPTALTEAT